MSSETQVEPVAVLPPVGELPQVSTRLTTSKPKNHLKLGRMICKNLCLKRECELQKTVVKVEESDEKKSAWSGVRRFPERKLLVMDLDETLIHSVQNPQDGDYELKVQTEHSAFAVGLRLRPYVRDFLEKASQLFEVAIFTSAQAPYADAVINFLDPEGRLVHHRLYRTHCCQVGGAPVKDLRVFQGVDLKDIIICDNIIANFKLQISNGVPIKTWTEDRNDKELALLIQYLQKLLHVYDVRVVNEHFFHLHTLLASAAKSS